MLRNKTLVLALACAALAPSAAGAATIGLTPSALDPPVASSFSLDVVVSGLGTGGAPSVGGFQIQLAYDPGLLLAQSVAFGTELGSGAQVLESSSFGGGQVTLNAVSLLSPGALDTLQGSSVTLGTVTFQRLTAGMGSVDFASVLISDAFALALPIDATSPARIGAAIPEPTAGLVYAVGLLVLRGALRTRRKAG